MEWFASFLSGRTQQIRVGNDLSNSNRVTSGVVQGSTLGPTLFTVLTDSLLCKLVFPAGAFADDFKFVADVTDHSQAEVQLDVDKIALWSAEHDMPLSLEKPL